MTKAEYAEIEAYMLACMTDSAHDREHVYRVLYTALDIAGDEPSADMDVLIAACLLHDIGRDRQLRNASLCHAEEGGRMAYDYLTSIGWSDERAVFVRDVVTSHRFRNTHQPRSIEAKILFDADKVDAVGALGLARTLLYEGRAGDALYSTGADGEPVEGEDDPSDPFFHEYKYKLERLYDRFYTVRGRELAQSRRQSAVEFWNALHGEIQETHDRGSALLGRMLL